jgi:hypothetical protein
MAGIDFFPTVRVELQYKGIIRVYVHDFFGI